MTTAVRFKICCIASVEEAALARGAGAHALGLVSAMPSGPGPIPDERIAAIAATVPPPTRTFLLTSRVEAAPIADQARRARVTTLQLVDSVAEDVYPFLREAVPEVELVQVIHVRGAEAVDEAAACAPHVDAILLDSGNPSLARKELGGTGRVHDWAVSRRVVEALNVPVWLAGGLHAGNVREAIAAVRPFGVDICSGVRTAGRLDPDKLAAFARAVAAA